LWIWKKLTSEALAIAAGSIEAKKRPSISVLSILTIGNFEKLLTKICRNN
jgi:hypothetical protein